MTHDELVRLYDAVVYAVGAQTDRRLGIPGEDLPGSWAATEFVAWYNAHPDFQELSFDLSGERAVVIGNGNVALDVARMLALTREELAVTDTTDPAIEAIAASGIRDILVVGRRGPVQAAWTTPELQELGELAGADIVVDPAELELDPASDAELEAATPIVRRNVEILREFASRKPEGKPRRIVLRFRVSPAAILGDERVEAVELVRNGLVPDGKGSVRASRRTSARRSRQRRLPQRGVPRRASGRPALRRTARHAAERRRQGARRRRAAASGRLLRRLDQAWPDRRDRDEQEGRDRDSRAVARGRAFGRAAGPRRVGGDAGGAARRPWGGRGRSMQAGRRSTRAERAAGEPHGRPRVKLRTWDELLAAAHA